MIRGRACSDTTRAALFIIYIVSIVTALANPADLNYEEALQLTQGANIIMLLLLSYCNRTLPDAVIAAVLGVAFTLRTTGSWQGGSRWDSFLVTVGALVILQHVFYLVLPHNVKHRRILYIAFSCLVMPVLASLPHLVRQPRIESDVLLKALEFSGQAYGLPKDGATPLVGPQWMVHDPDTDTIAGITKALNADAHTDIYIYFAGTQTRKDWENNIDIREDTVPVEWDCGSSEPLRTHKGYTKAFKSVQDKLLVALKEELATSHPDSRIIFCGHSLGGAMATLAATFVACKLPSMRPNTVLVTFAAPQVGDGNFVAFFNKIVPTSVRVVNPMDPVPRLLNMQLVHVKGYYPIGTFSFDAMLKAHDLSTYEAGLRRSRAMSILASSLPAVVAAAGIGVYIAWHLRRV
jgi:hypothetical protein